MVEGVIVIRSLLCLVVVLLGLASCSVLAQDVGVDLDVAVVTGSLLAALFGDSVAANVLGVIAVALGVWAQVRMLIPPHWLAWT